MVWTPSSRKPARSSAPKNKPLIQPIDVISYSLLCQIVTNNSFEIIQIKRFQVLSPGLTSAPHLESESRLEIVTQLVDTRKQPSSHL
jgi:hypothetical protein